MTEFPRLQIILLVFWVFNTFLGGARGWINIDTRAVFFRLFSPVVCGFLLTSWSSPSVGTVGGTSREHIENIRDDCCKYHTSPWQRCWNCTHLPCVGDTRRVASLHSVCLQRHRELHTPEKGVCVCVWLMMKCIVFLSRFSAQRAAPMRNLTLPACKLLKPAWNLRGVTWICFHGVRLPHVDVFPWFLISPCEAAPVDRHQCLRRLSVEERELDRWVLICGGSSAGFVSHTFIHKPLFMVIVPKLGLPVRRSSVLLRAFQCGDVCFS